MRNLVKLAVALLMTGLVGASAAQAQVRTSLPYRTIDPPLAPVSGVLGDSPRDKIEVIQFFYYGCPHCFDQQPLIEDWLAKKPADVEFRYIPALRDDKWLTLTRAYFALEHLGEAMRLHRPIYDVINFDSVNLAEEARLIDWVSRNGVDRARFVEALNSDQTRAKVEAVRKLSNDYNVRATPTLVVAGKYLFASGQAGSHHEALRLLEQFIEVARREKR
ncbi:MAG: thiol:disulfide interchange protein DsbA/DsbL [Burkholderiales bacterium]